MRIVNLAGGLPPFGQIGSAAGLEHIPTNEMAFWIEVVVDRGVHRGELQQIFNLPQRQWIPDIHYHCEANDPGRVIEVAEGVFHHRRLSSPSANFNPI